MRDPCFVLTSGLSWGFILILIGGLWIDCYWNLSPPLLRTLALLYPAILHSLLVIFFYLMGFLLVPLLSLPPPSDDWNRHQVRNRLSSCYFHPEPTIDRTIKAPFKLTAFFNRPSSHRLRCHIRSSVAYRIAMMFSLLSRAVTNSAQYNLLHCSWFPSSFS